MKNVIICTMRLTWRLHVNAPLYYYMCTFYAGVVGRCLLRVVLVVRDKELCETRDSRIATIWWIFTLCLKLVISDSKVNASLLPSFFCRCNLCYCSVDKGSFVYKSGMSRIQISWKRKSRVNWLPRYSHENRKCRVS